MSPSDPPSDRDDPEHAPREADASLEIAAASPLPAALMPMARKPRRTSTGSRGPLSEPLKIALLAGGALLLLFVLAALVVWSNHRAAVSAAARAAQQAIELHERDNRERAEAAQRAQAEQQRAAEQQTQARLERVRDEQRRADEAQKAASDEAERKQRAWEATYRKPPGCTDMATLECSNHYIRARRAFEERYVKGQP